MADRANRALTKTIEQVPLLRGLHFVVHTAIGPKLPDIAAKRLDLWYNGSLKSIFDVYDMTVDEAFDTRCFTIDVYSNRFDAAEWTSLITRPFSGPNSSIKLETVADLQKGNFDLLTIKPISSQDMFGTLRMQVRDLLGSRAVKTAVLYFLHSRFEYYATLKPNESQHVFLELIGFASKSDWDENHDYQFSASRLRAWNVWKMTRRGKSVHADVWGLYAEQRVSVGPLFDLDAASVRRTYEALYSPIRRQQNVSPMFDVLSRFVGELKDAEGDLKPNYFPRSELTRSLPGEMDIVECSQLTRLPWWVAQQPFVSLAKPVAVGSDYFIHPAEITLNLSSLLGVGGYGAVTDSKWSARDRTLADSYFLPRKHIFAHSRMLVSILTSEARIVDYMRSVQKLMGPATLVHKLYGYYDRPIKGIEFTRIMKNGDSAGEGLFDAQPTVETEKIELAAMVGQDGEFDEIMRAKEIIASTILQDARAYAEYEEEDGMIISYKTQAETSAAFKFSVRDRSSVLEFVLGRMLTDAEDRQTGPALIPQGDDASDLVTRDVGIRSIVKDSKITTSVQLPAGNDTLIVQNTDTTSNSPITITYKLNMQCRALPNSRSITGVPLMTNLYDTRDNVISPLGYSYAEEVVVLMYEKLAGSLNDMFKKLTRRPTLYETIRIFLDAVRGLIWLHANGVAHYDVKSANILVTNDHRGILADLGVSRPYGVPVLGVWGTPTFYPDILPNQAPNGFQVDPTLDAYALAKSILAILNEHFSRSTQQGTYAQSSKVPVSVSPCSSACYAAVKEDLLALSMQILERGEACTLRVVADTKANKPATERSPYEATRPMLRAGASILRFMEAALLVMLAAMTADITSRNQDAITDLAISYLLQPTS